jgi:hypothetical protein
MWRMSAFYYLLVTHVSMHISISSLVVLVRCSGDGKTAGSNPSPKRWEGEWVGSDCKPLLAQHVKGGVNDGRRGAAKDLNPETKLCSRMRAMCHPISSCF